MSVNIDVLTAQDVALINKLFTGKWSFTPVFKNESQHDQVKSKIHCAVRFRYAS